MRSFNFFRRSFRPFSESINGWKIQLNVINALIYRELKTRISQVKFGLLGVFIEPVGVIAIFLIIFSWLRGLRQDLDTTLFLAAGIVLFSLFNDIAIRSVNAMKANEALFFYRPLKPVDTVIARGIVETGLYSIVFLTITLTIFLFRERWILQDFPLYVFSFISLAFFASGFGLILMVAGHRYPSLNQFVPLFMRPIWFLSGVFFSLTDIPSWLRPWLSWNPILQAIELTRYSFSKSYNLHESISLFYLLTTGFLIWTLGLWIYLNNEKLLLTR